VVLVAVSFAPNVVGLSGWVYGVIAAITGTSFLYLAWRLFRSSEARAMKKVARSLFTYSLSYLFVIFLALIVDRVAQLAGWVA
jgi:protoheme IX farnesyltransferase